jgi:hypothetical protein
MNFVIMLRHDHVHVNWRFHMKKIACIALALSLASTAAFSQAVGDDVTALAPGGAAAAVAGQTVVIAGVGTATWAVVGGALLLILVSLASDSSTPST